MPLNPDIYEKAAHEIEVRGWYQGDYVSPYGKVCALGAIRLALGAIVEDYGGGDVGMSGPTPSYVSGEPYASIAEHVYAEKLLDHLKDNRDEFPFESIPHWNDDLETTEEMVTEALRAYADHLRG